MALAGKLEIPLPHRSCRWPESLPALKWCSTSAWQPGKWRKPKRTLYWTTWNAATPAQKTRGLPEPDRLLNILRHADSLGKDSETLVRLVEHLSKLRPWTPAWGGADTAAAGACGAAAVEICLLRVWQEREGQGRVGRQEGQVSTLQGAGARAGGCCGDHGAWARQPAGKVNRGRRQFLEPSNEFECGPVPAGS